MSLNDLQIEGFTVKGSTQSLTKVVKTNVKDRIEVEIGDSKDSLKFQPQAKIMRWDNEVNLSVRRKEPETAEKSAPTIKSVKDTVVWEKDKEEVHIYEKPEIAGDGGLEIEVLLKEKPINNVIEFSLETKGLEFFYQPALTQEEIDGGAERPENITGSYAVYYKDVPMNKVGGKEYRVGKVCHIYRPKVVDANGMEVWGKLNINEDKKLLTVIVDQDFLDSAVYPVVVDPTFGFTGVGGSTFEIYAGGYWRFGKNNLSVGGSVSQISMYGKTSGTANFMSGIYSEDSSNPTLPDVLQGETDKVSLSYNYDPSWKNFTPENTTISLAAGNYWMGLYYSDSSFYHYYDTSVSNILATINYSYNGSLPADATSRTWMDTPSTPKLSIYATYTEAASGTEASSDRGLYTKGKLTGSSDRLLYSKGSIAGSSERLLYTKGSHTLCTDQFGVVFSSSVQSSSERNLYTKGVATSSSDRNLYSLATLGGDSERLLYSKANDTDTSERLLYSEGSVLASSDRGLYSNGATAGSSDRFLYTEGSISDTSDRLVYSKGIATASSERSLYSVGGGVVSSERAIHTLGEALGDSERGIYTQGSETDSSIRNIYSEGSSLSSSERNIYTIGISTSSSERPLYTIGSILNSSERLLYSLGISISSSERGIYAEGDSPNASERSIYTIGVSTGSSEKQIYSWGFIDSNSERGLYSSGVLRSSSERDIYTIGKSTSSSERVVYTYSVEAGSSERGIYTLGVYTEDSERVLYTRGGSSDISERGVYSKGGIPANSIRSLYTKGTWKPWVDKSVEYGTIYTNEEVVVGGNFVDLTMSGGDTFVNDTATTGTWVDVKAPAADNFIRKV